jgi:hypothetical protein
MDVLGLPDEGRATLMTAALASPDRALDGWRRWERSGADARADPVAQRWLPLIGWNLSHAPLDDATKAMFRDARHEMWASNVRMINASRPALDALHAVGIPTIVLKGAALTNTVYDVPGLRPIGDVDVLVEAEHRGTAQRIVADLGWQPLRRTSPRDLLLAHGLDLRKPPHGALDVHWYLLHECSWPSVDRALWGRARPFPSMGSCALTLSPADQLMHVCLHGLRWSPVHGGHWVADAVRVIASANGSLDWDVVVEEARSRRMQLQMAEALRVVRQWGGAEVPDRVFRALGDHPASWTERMECRLKGRPVVSAGGLFVIWTGWLRTRRAARAEGASVPPWSRYLAAALGVNSPLAIVPRMARHMWHGVTGLFHREPRRGATSRERLVERGSRP